MTVWLWIGVGLAGGCGAVCRWLVESAVTGRLGRRLPWGTTVVNLSGALALGFVVGLAPDQSLRVLLGTAALGSYTTFSGWILATDRLAGERGPAAAVLNLALPLALGLAAAALAHALGAALR
ncbi:MAG: fluoride efflux transporter CrcB [Solirubrobacterales bacterium]|nr:fluoride efflux transporter CrcB [Solirubrobacterales bacterium]